MIAPDRDPAAAELSRRALLRRAGLVGVGLAAAGYGATAGRIAATAAGGPRSESPWVPGEEGAHARTWMAWPSSNRIWGRSLLAKVQGDVARCADEIARSEPVVICADGRSAARQARLRCGPAVSVISSIPVNDCWMRDTAPLFRIDGAGGLDAFGLNFNGWGDKQIHGKDGRVARRLSDRLDMRFSRAAIVGEGGGVECDGDGTLLATESSWINRNRNPGASRSLIEAELLRRFGAGKLIWVSPGIRGRDITDDHVDATSRFVRPGVVMVQLPPPGRNDVWAEDARRQHATLSGATDARGRRLRVLTVEGPDELPRLPARDRGSFLDSYVNWCVTNKTVITTQFGDAVKDAAAKAAIGAAFPGRTVVQLNLDRLYGAGGGGIHCITMQEPRPT